MLDIDRNINSPVYEITSGDYINKISNTIPKLSNLIVISKKVK